MRHLLTFTSRLAGDHAEDEIVALENAIDEATGVSGMRILGPVGRAPEDRDLQGVPTEERALARRCTGKGWVLHVGIGRRLRRAAREGIPAGPWITEVSNHTLWVDGEDLVGLAACVARVAPVLLAPSDAAQVVRRARILVEP